MDAAEKKCLDDIEKYGCHVIHVLAEKGLPPFSYSVGIEQSLKYPEVIVIGLRRDVAHFMINTYCARARSGEKFQTGQRVEDLLEGFACELRQVAPSHYQHYVGWDLWFYRDTPFRLFQLVYPNTLGVWPWDSDCEEAFKAWQPVLDNEANSPRPLTRPLS